MAKACEKRPISPDDMEKVVEDIIGEIESGQEREIPTKLIGAKVMERLRGLDSVAYVRYASVYRQFQEIGDFIDEIQSLKKRGPVVAAQPELFKT